MTALGSRELRKWPSRNWESKNGEIFPPASHRSCGFPMSAITKSGELVHEPDYSLKSVQLQLHHSALGFRSLSSHGLWWDFPRGRFVTQQFGCAGQSVSLIPSSQKHAPFCETLKSCWSQQGQWISSYSENCDLTKPNEINFAVLSRE